jgi:tetratricopeptide (TPR) repeat protein
MKPSLIITLIFCIIKTGFAQDTAKTNYNLLLDYYQSQRYDKAADYLKANNSEPITNVKILKALAYCNQMQGHLPEAAVYYQRVYQLDSTNTAVLFNLGSINLSRGNFPLAESWYKRILLRDSSNFMVYKQLGNISLQKSEFPQALTYFDRANQLNNTDADVAAALSDLYITGKKDDLAEKVLGAAIKVDPENMELLESLVKLEYAQSKWQETINNCEKLVELGNMSGPVLTKLGISYFYLKDYRCCIESMALIDKLEQNETTYYFTAESYKALKDYNTAVTWYYKTIKSGISPNINNYYSEIADSYETLKEFNKAGIAYQKALQFEEKPLTYYLIAELYDTDIKNKKKALVYYKKFLATNPKADMQKYISYARGRVSTSKME